MKDLTPGLKLAHVGASAGRLSLIFSDPEGKKPTAYISLEGGELQRVCDEVAMNAPERLHKALENRTLSLIREIVAGETE